MNNNRLDDIQKLVNVFESNKRELIERSMKDLGSHITFLDEQFKYGIQIMTDLQHKFNSTTPKKNNIAILFPANSEGVLPLYIISVAYLLCDQVKVKFSSKTPRISNYLETLIQSCMNVDISQQQPGKTFILQNLEDVDNDILLVFGHDSWAKAYEPQVRRSNKKFIFEGPGKNPFLVLRNADIEKAAYGAIESSFFNTGQACMASERFYVHADIKQQFIDYTLKYIKNLKQGKLSDSTTSIGLITNPYLAKNIEKQIKDSTNKGGIIEIGGHIEQMDVNGQESFFIEPTLISNCNHKMDIMRKETFGPIIPLQEFSNISEVIDFVDDCDYGLSATLFGYDASLCAFLRQTHASFFHNQTMIDGFKPYMFGGGGYKNSAWIWEWKNNLFIRREGPRKLEEEIITLIPERK